jgi:hypothetical protein
MNLIAEGIDRGNVRLILKESAEFTKAFNDLKGSISDFMGLIGTVGLEGMKEPYTNLQKLVVKAEQGLDDLPEEWSWDDQINALKATSKDSPPETLVSQIALSHDSNVNACKDAVITIAEFLEKNGKGLFKIGSAGLNIDEKFKKALKVPEFKLAQLTEKDFIFSLVGVDKVTDVKENEKAVKEAWKGVWNPTNKPNADKDWETFQNLLENLGKGIPDLYKECGKAIKNGKPSPEFEDQVPKKGLVSSLLSGLFAKKDPTRAAPEPVMGTGPDDPNGLLGMPFAKLSELVVGLLKMSGKASDAAAGSVQAIQDNQEAVAKEVWGEEVRDTLLKGYSEKPKDPQDLKGMPKTAKAMGAFEEILGKDKSPKIDDIKKIEDLTKKLASLEKYKFELQDDIDELFKILGIEVEEVEEEEEITPIEFDGKKHRTNELNDFIKKNLGTKWGREDVEFAFQVLKDEGLITLREGLRDSKADFKKEFLEKVKAKIEGGNMKPDNKKKSLERFDDKALEVLWKYFKEKGVQLNESVVFERWGVLAGIIKG